jgi:hypothetical protein
MGAEDSEGTFGGNGSVHWKVEAKHVKSFSHQAHGNGHYRQEGHSGSVEGGRFAITLARPAGAGEPEVLVKGLRAAAAAIEGGAREVTFELAIEKGRHRQITVKWESADEKFTPTTA